MTRATLTNAHSGRNVALGDTDTGDIAAPSTGATRHAAYRAIRSWATYRPRYVAPTVRGATVDVLAAIAAPHAETRRMRAARIAAILRGGDGPRYRGNGPDVSQEAARATLRATRPTRDRMTLVRLLVDTVTRERIAALSPEHLAWLMGQDTAGATHGQHRGAAAAMARHLANVAAPDARDVARAGWDDTAWRGLVPAREARHSERGRGSSRLMASAAKVSTRDAHRPPETLKQVRTVGHATHPAASPADNRRLMAAVLAHPTWATLTRMMPGPHGLIRTVLPVSVYRDAARDAESARRTHTGPGTVSPDAARMAADVAAMGRMGQADPAAAAGYSVAAASAR